MAMRDYQESMTPGQTDTHRQKPDKVIPMCRYASQATQKYYVYGKLTSYGLAYEIEFKMHVWCSIKGTADRIYWRMSVTHH